MKIERKLIVIGLALLLTAIGSAWGAYRTITSTNDNYTTFIRTSTGNIYNVTGANLQTAIDSLGGAGGTVYLPAGNITITTDITMSSKITLQGAGKDATTLKLGAASSTVYVIECDGINNFTICDLSINGNDGSITENYWAIGLFSCRYFNLHNIHVYNMYRAGIGFSILGVGTGCYWGHVYNIDIDDIDDSPTTQQSIAGAYVKYTTFENIHIKGDGVNATTYYTWGMDMSGWEWVTFNDIYIQGTGGGFKTIGTCHNLTFNNLYLRNLTNNGSVPGFQMQGMWLAGSGGNLRDCNFNNVNIEYCWRGIQIDGGGQRLNFNNINIQPNSRSKKTQAHCIYCTGDYINFNNAYLKGAISSSGSGLYLYGCDDSIFSNIKMHYCYTGLYMENCDRCTFSNMEIYYCSYGVYGKTNTYFAIADSVINDNTGNGIDLGDATACHNFSITNNILNNNGALAVNIRADCNYFICTGNICYPSTDELDFNAPASATRCANVTYGCYNIGTSLWA